jgi:hypothetical protein
MECNTFENLAWSSRIAAAPPGVACPASTPSLANPAPCLLLPLLLDEYFQSKRVWAAGCCSSAGKVLHDNLGRSLTSAAGLLPVSAMQPPCQ